MTTKRIRQIVLGLLFGVWVSSCQEDNPAYLGKIPRDAGPDTATVTPGEDALPEPDAEEPSPDVVVDEKDQRTEADAADSAGGQPDAGRDADKGDDVLPNPDEEADVPPIPSDGTDGPDATLPDARDGRDGRGGDGLENKDLGTDPGHEPDGAAEETFDAFDGPTTDGTPDAPVIPDGPVEVVVTAEVAVDISPACREGEQRFVVSPGNPLVAPCRGGQQTCTGGVWVTSVEEIVPAAEKCNGADDDCNGMVDEGCASQCVVVSPTGSESGDGSAQNPYRTIEQAIAAAGAGDGGSRTQVCVSGGSSCQAATTYPSVAPIAMRDGISVQGNYALDESGVIYCGLGARPTTTIEFSTPDQGVVFSQNVVSRTELSGFVIHRFSASTGGPVTTSPIAGVVISGAKDVRLSRIFVDDAVDGTSTYGVSIGGGGRATIVGSAIGGGLGRTSAVGVHVSGGSVDLRNNCDNAVAGVCKTACSDSNTSLGIRGRQVGGAGDSAGETSAVFLDNSGTSSATASTAIGNMICGGPSNLAESGASGAGIAALRCSGGDCGLISGNTIAGGGGRLSVGVALAGAQRGLLTGNRIQGGCGTQSAAGVLLENTAAQLQNNLIFGGSCPNAGSGQQTAYYGLHVVLDGASSTTAEDFQVHSNDIEPEGSTGDCDSIGVFVERRGGETGPATGILRNNIISTGLCDRRYGVSESSGALLHYLENNDLYGDVQSETAALYRRNDSKATTEDAVNALAGASNNISADPQYVSFPTDLHLTSGSRCIDKGTATGAPSSDAEGTPRPQGDKFDIGAFELKN